MFEELRDAGSLELARDPHAALLFPWVALERQVLITGRVERVSVAEATAYFITRPVGSQLAAWASPRT